MRRHGHRRLRGASQCNDSALYHFTLGRSAYEVSANTYTVLPQLSCMARALHSPVASVYTTWLQPFFALASHSVVHDSGDISDASWATCTGPGYAEACSIFSHVRPANDTVVAFDQYTSSPARDGATPR